MAADAVVSALMPRSDSVCFITQNASFGGMEVHTLGLMHALIEAGYRIELVVNRYFEYDPIVDANHWQKAVSIIHTTADGLLYGDRIDVRAWKRILRSIRSRVLVFPKGNNNFGQPRFLRLCRRKFERIVFIEHLEPYARPTSSRRWLGFVPGAGVWWHKRVLLSRVGSRYADRIVTVSRRIRDRLVEDFRYEPGKLVVVHNGVSWQTLIRNEAMGAAFRTQHQICADSFVFGMLTRLSPEKGVDIAVRAVKILATRFPEVPFVLAIAGTGGQLDCLRRLAVDLGIQSRLRFVGFVRNRIEALSSFDAILFPSSLEGLPLALLEGMAAGCIPIVARVSGMPEAIDSSSVGWLVQPTDPAAFASAMEQVLRLDKPSISGFRKNVAERIRQAFDAATTYRRIMEACELNVPAR